MKRLICFLLTIVLLGALAGCGGAESLLSEADALAKLDAYMDKKISTNIVAHDSDTSWVGSEESMNELPPIEKYPFSVEGTSAINVEIFSSTEKSDAKTDRWFDQMAREFNAAAKEVNGRRVSVSIRPMSSGLALDFIQTRTYIPTAYTPSNELWGRMIEAKGIRTKLIEQRLTGNTAGIMMEPNAYKDYIDKYGEVTMPKVMEAVFSGDIDLGHTDPNTSSTGLVFLALELLASDSNNPFGTTAIEKFRQFQKMTPAASPTTAELIKVADKGILNAIIMSPSEWSRYPTLSKWVFTPLGVRQDSPLYALEGASDEEQEVLKLFAEYCKQQSSQNAANSLGFNQFDDFWGEDIGFSGSELFSAQDIWKKNKDGGDPVISVIVMDCSGSMDTPDRLPKAKRALLSSIPHTNEDNYIGLISYSSTDRINIDLPLVKQTETGELELARFDGKRQAMFAGAVKDLKAGGATATNSAIGAALHMAKEAKALAPNAKIRILVFTDGATNMDQVSFGEIEGIVHGLGIPIYGVFFMPEKPSDMDELIKLTAINEGYTIDADNEDVVYKLQGLFRIEL